MPELPEVETIARDIRPQVVGAAFRRVRVLKSDVLGARPAPAPAPSTAAFARALRGRTVLEVGRRAKHLVLTLDDGARVVIQPGMTGSVLCVADACRSGDPYLAVEAQLTGGKRLLYRDVRRLGRVFLLSSGEWERYSAGLGPEPLHPEFTAQRLRALLAGGRLAVKKAIMDQRRLAGVGNIYANEALWRARIDPSRAAGSLSAPEAGRLHRAIVGVLQSAIAERGTTVRDYRTGTGERGRFQFRLEVYGRAGEPCRRCGRRVVLTHAVDARATYFCARCQR